MSTYEVGPFQLNVEQLLLTHDGEPVGLGPKVVATLLALVEHPGEVLAKRVLVDRIWPDGFVEEANLAQNIHVLRKTFRHHGGDNPIETVPCRGYRLTAPVRAGAAPPLDVRVAVQPRRTLAPRFAAVTAGVAGIAASIMLAASAGHHPLPQAALSHHGAQLYAVGQYYWNLRTRAGLEKSFSYFSQVVDSNPQDPRGYAALADVNVTMGEYCYGTHSPAVYFARARELALKALALSPDSAEAHAALGILAFHRDDMPAATTALERAIALDPSYAPAQEWYGITLLGRGRLADGVARLKVAAELDPLSVSTIAWLATAAYRDRRFGDAVLYARQALELSPQRIDALTTLGKAYEAQGDIDRAIEAFKRYRDVGAYYHPEADALIAHAYALGRRTHEAGAALGSAARRSPPRHTHSSMYA